ncbi:MAG: DNA/RNA non-specific endonuclease [Bacteroidota bacterium]
MAKFRTNHIKQGSGSSFGCVTPLILFGMVIGLLWAIKKYPNFFNQFFDLDEEIINFPDTEVKDYEAETLFFLPSSESKAIIRHKHYALAYNEQHEVAEWVAYELTRDQLNQNRVRREDNYRSDPKVKTESATSRDYSGSGYDRGHLLPVGDRKFSFEAMDETFFMSNISPQVRNFNSGIWRELEEDVRDWARKYRKVYVVTGPVLKGRPKERIGRNKVSVPRRFYKVILDISDPELKGIGFIIPNEVSDKELQEYAVAIDEVEALTGIDFFPDLMEDDLEKELESEFDTELWDFDLRRYETRINVWNVR